MRSIIHKVLIATLIIFVAYIVCIKLLSIRIIITEKSVISESGLIKLEHYYKLDNNVNEQYILNNKGTYFISILENGNETKYSYKDFNILANVTKETIEYIDNHIILNNNKLKVEFTYDDLIKSVEKLNNNRYKNDYSKIEISDNKFTVTDEIFGNYIDTDKLCDYIVDNIGNNIRVELEQFYVPFDVNMIRQSTLQAKVDKIYNTYITYDNGYILRLVDFFDRLELNNNEIYFSIVDTEEFFIAVSELLKTNLESYNTVGKEKEFTTTNNETIKISGGTWGDIVDIESETNYVIDLLSNFQKEENRIPILKQDYANDIPSKYIEISINDQYLWYYNNNELVMESEIVTGTKGKHDTPVGVYFISEKINGKYLRGDDYVTWVNKWLRITNRGHGLHDATWRGSFGGNIYTYNGSHGCINLPKSFAYKLFEEIVIHDCVIIY